MEEKQFHSELSAIFAGIEEWAKIDTNIQRWVSARKLHTECQRLLFGDEKPHYFWPTSVKSFSKLIVNNDGFLCSAFGWDMKIDSHDKTLRYLIQHRRRDNTFF